MRAVDIINKKKHAEVLSKEEITYFIEGYTNGDIPDYQMSALCMAVYFNGMNADETTALTMAMVDSGDRVDLSAIKGVTVDKHSTGGVGDKTTLIVMPIVAALGLSVAKMSGRGLGHTGGTVDKLESIPGFCTKLSSEEFLNIVNTNGLCVAGQSGNLAPADKKIYALRDVTATVDCLPLIAASIMSKKIAAGADVILLDVKSGSGAFMKTLDDSIALAQAMVDIGVGCGRKTAALITDMDVPLGCAIGNALEIIEVVQILSNNKDGCEDLLELCRALSANLLLLAGKGSIEACYSMVDAVLADGSALKKLAEMVAAQKGDGDYILHPEKFEEAPLIIDVIAPQSGYIEKMDTEGIGVAAMLLGAGRERAEDEIDYSAGIVLKAKTGDYVTQGQNIAVFHTSGMEKFRDGEQMFLKSLTFSKTKPATVPVILSQIGF